MYSYCLFCETIKCRFVVYALMAMFDCTALSPKQVQHTWKDGKMIDRLKGLLPGYVFLYSEEPVNIFTCLSIPGVLRCLRTSDQYYELTGSDEAFAQMLLQKGGVVGKTRVDEKDGLLTLSEGAFAGLKARILKVDRRNHRMQIEIPFAKRLVKTWVEYEIIPSDENKTKLSEGRKEMPDDKEPDQGRTENTAAGGAE